MSFQITEGALEKYSGNSADVCIPEGVTVIENGAFWYCESVRCVVVPKSVEKIGRLAFNVCENLEEIIILGEIKKIDWCSFQDCVKLREVRTEIAGQDALRELILASAKSKIKKCYSLCQTIGEPNFCYMCMPEYADVKTEVVDGKRIFTFTQTYMRCGPRDYWGTPQYCISSIEIPDTVEEDEIPLYLISHKDEIKQREKP